MDLDILWSQFHKYQPMLDELHETWTAQKEVKEAAAKEAADAAAEEAAAEPAASENGHAARTTRAEGERPIGRPQ